MLSDSPESSMVLVVRERDLNAKALNRLGAPGGIRTPNLLLRTELLFR